MRRPFATFGTTLMLAIAVASAASAEIGIITAGENGTYYQFGLDRKSTRLNSSHSSPRRMP